jgi:hypothetical protein
MTRYHYTTSVSFGGDEPAAEFEVTLSYTVAWGSPETGRFGPPEDYDPGSGDLVEDIRVEKIDGKARPWWWIYGTDDERAATIIDHIGDKLDDELIANAVEHGEYERDQAAEMRAEARRDY